MDATDVFRSSRRSWNSCACDGDCGCWGLSELARFRLVALGEESPGAGWCSTARSPLLCWSEVMVMVGLVPASLVAKVAMREDALCFGKLPQLSHNSRLATIQSRDCWTELTAEVNSDSNLMIRQWKQSFLRQPDSHSRSQARRGPCVQRLPPLPLRHERLLLCLLGGPTRPEPGHNFEQLVLHVNGIANWEQTCCARPDECQLLVLCPSVDGSNMLPGSLRPFQIHSATTPVAPSPIAAM